MGLTTELVHVAAGNGLDVTGLADAVRELVREDGGFVEATAGAADVTEILMPVEANRWLPVLDGGVFEPAVLARRLSKTLATVAATTAVFDSDDPTMKLFRAGKPAGSLTVRPGRKPSLTRPESWQELLAGATVGDLRAAAAARDVFVEDTLYRVADLIGMGRRHAAAVADDFLGRPQPDGYLRLTFQSAMPVSVQTEPPALVAEGATAPPSIGVGAILERQFNAMFHNAGGPGRGVRMELSGAALDGGLVEVTKVEFVEFTWDKRVGLSTIRHEARMVGRAVEAADVELHDSPPIHLAGSVAAANRAARQWSRRKLAINLFGRVLAPGAGEMRVLIAPMENPSGDANTALRVNATR